MNRHQRVLARGLLCLAFVGCGPKPVVPAAPGDPCAAPDADGDGHDANACGGDDCDDGNPESFPGNPEICDARGEDEDCDPTTFGIRDADADGSPDAQCCNGENCGYDCDDTREGVHPNLPEVCDERDNDCDGSIDEGVVVLSYMDEDGDGYGIGPQELRCAGTSSYATTDGDCDDTLAEIHPGAFRCSQDAAAVNSDIEVCESDGGWTILSCPDLGLCVPQPDATGVCLPGEAAPACSDGEDNDRDGQTDWSDTNCTSPLDNTEGERACADGKDNDSDEFVDFPDDPGCSSAEDNSETDSAAPPACANGLDDDGDGAIDYLRGMGDRGCVSAADGNERQADGATCDNGLDDNGSGGTDFPADAVCPSMISDAEMTPACSNGIDDDLDGYADYSAVAGGDPGCISATDTSERAAPNSNYTCDNGLDDDMDGVADFPGDVGCKSVQSPEL
jgi:hypothetical protein